MAKLMRLRELAEYLDVSESTVHNWRYRGEGPPGFKVGGQVRYRREDVEEWLEEQADDRQPA